MGKKIPADIKLHLEKFIDFTADKISEAIIKKIGPHQEDVVLDDISTFFERVDYQYGIKEISFLYNDERTKCEIETYSFIKNKSAGSKKKDSKKDEFDDDFESDPEKSLDDDDLDFSEDDDFDDEDDFDKDEDFGDDDDDFGDDDFFGSISFFSNIKDWFSETFKLSMDNLMLFDGPETIGDRVFSFAQKKALLKAVKKIEKKGIKLSTKLQLTLTSGDYEEIINNDNFIEWHDIPGEIIKTPEAIAAFAMICFDSDEFRGLIK